MKIKIMKSYTNITQSKKLVEILPKESANAFYDMAEPEKRQVPIMGHPDEYYDMKDWAIPCWSLAALLDILPSEFKYYETTYEIDIRKYVLTDDVDLYQIAYRNCKIDEDGHHSWKDMINTGEKEDLVDACVEMIIKLHEQKLI